MRCVPETPKWVPKAHNPVGFDHGGEYRTDDYVASQWRTSEMRSYDLSPLFRSTVGFDRMNRLFDTAFNTDVPSYPPYNIEKLGEDAYRVTMAVAGFGTDDLEITQKDNALLIKGNAKANGDGTTYLHRGIAARAFERRFALAEHVNVVNASVENGILVVDLKREVPEALKPRKIAITGAGTAKPIEQKAA
jgi:molecular chaperone IbpA